MNQPTGFLGKNFEDMSNAELKKAFFYAWDRMEQYRKELRLYELNLNNTKITK